MLSLSAGATLIWLWGSSSERVELGTQSMFHECQCNELKHSGYKSPSRAALESLGSFAQRKEEFHSTVRSCRSYILLVIPQKCGAPWKRRCQAIRRLTQKMNKERPSLGLSPVGELEGSSWDLTIVAMSSSAGGLPLITNWKRIGW